MITFLPNPRMIRFVAVILLILLLMGIVVYSLVLLIKGVTLTTVPESISGTPALPANVEFIPDPAIGKVISFLVLILGCILISAGCQTDSGVQVTKEVISLPITTTPVACADSSAVSLVASPTARTNVNEVLVSLTGLEPGEPIVFLFESNSLTETSVTESRPVAVADAAGNYSYKEQGFRKLDGKEKNQWLVKAIHKRGVNCTSVTLPR